MRWLFPLLLLGCGQTVTFNEYRVQDVYRQRELREVDILVVVDNSCSMAEEQENLATNFQDLIAAFVDADVAWRIGVTTTDLEHEWARGQLMGGDDEILLRTQDGIIERVDFDRSWGFELGKALQLNGRALTPAESSNPDKWCLSPLGDEGSPGELNPRCNGEVVNRTPGAEDNGPRLPVGGDLVISEIATHPGFPECEWFEIVNVSNDTLDLSGLRVQDDGTNESIIPPGNTIAPLEPLVLSRTGSCGADIVLPNFSLDDPTRWISHDTPLGEELFRERVAQGTLGTGVEMGFEQARLVLEAEIDPQNAEFLRPEASFSLLFVSDENDFSPGSVSDYVRTLGSFKGDAAFRQPGFFSISGVVGTTEPPGPELPSCESDNGFGEFGPRYLEAISLTGGLSESICAQDFAPIVNRLGLTLAGLTVEFALTQLPIVPTLVVELYDPEKELVRPLELGVDFIYDVERNVLVFEEADAPPPGYSILIQYEPSATGEPILEVE